MDLDCYVTIPDGKLFGAKGESLYSKTKYFKFCGIPYAQPPIGHLRFLPPRPPKKWPGTLDATTEKPGCLQHSLFHASIVGSEDCLYLNVHTLEAPRKVTRLKPVIVQIHAGGHFWGSSSSTSFGCPDFFIHQDVIFVSMNYRLHVFGFLNLEIPQCAGNMGLKDQSLALKWVKENIKYFGGDPDNITVYGNSSGASDLHFHMMSPMSKDLFHKGIMQCGYGLNAPWSYQTNHIERAFQLANELHYSGKTVRGLFHFLKKQNALLLLTAFLSLRKRLMKTDIAKGDICVFHATIEVIEENAFLCRSPRELIKNASPKPLICSITANEGVMSFFANPLKLLQNHFEDPVREHLWQYKINDQMIQAISREMKTFYFGEKEADEEMLKEIINMYTDMWYCEWNDWLDEISTNPTESPVYVYYFNHEGPLNFQQQHFSKYHPKASIKEAGHGDDGGYFVFYKISDNLKPPLKIRECDLKVIENMTTLLTNFAKKGDPNNEKFENIQWVPHNANNPSYLHLDENLEVVTGRIFEKRAIFWHNLMIRIKDHENKISNLTN